MAAVGSTPMPSLEGEFQPFILDPRLKRLTVAIMVLSIIVIGLVACGLFLANSTFVQMAIWITTTCITLAILLCACFRYKILRSMKPLDN
ncbi:hypothetical protein C10C_0398 [Chlamydia serpentis]|uniref:Uncharacterized protein n=1 Tax=Chlamydia serpentis TaxID=1967782 RepID=A0A2R8FBE4_9CHLA|nr:hypothetical protein [Chlamydia serpentis]SPN73567.1 hypothetical protein C10C_0398 [Chlamydia serpentis]